MEPLTENQLAVRTMLSFIPLLIFGIYIAVHYTRNSMIANVTKKSIEKILTDGWMIQDLSVFTIRKKSNGVYLVYVEVVNEKINDWTNDHISIRKDGTIVQESLTRNMERIETYN